MVALFESPVAKLSRQVGELDAQVVAERANAAAARQRKKSLADQPEAYEAECRAETDALSRVQRLEERRNDLAPLIAAAEAREHKAKVDEVEARAKARATKQARLASKAHKALKSAISDLEELRRLNAEHDADNAFLRANGRTPVASGEIEARTVPGRTIAAQFETRPAWVKPNGAPVTMFGKNRAGEMMPVEGGMRKTTERVCIQEEQHIPARSPKSLVDAVVVPGWMGDDKFLWGTR